MKAIYQIPQECKGETLPEWFIVPPEIGDSILTLEGTELVVRKRIHLIDEGEAKIKFRLEKP